MAVRPLRLSVIVGGTIRLRHLILFFGNDSVEGLALLDSLANLGQIHEDDVSERVLGVVGRGSSFAEARERAYAGVDRIALAGGQHRRDIALRVVEA